MLPLRALLILLCLAPLPAFASQETVTPSAVSRCGDGETTADSAPQLPVRQETAQLLLAEPGKRPKATEEERFRLEAGNELVAVTFLNDTSFIPWLGAGLELEEGAAPAAYRFGAGLGCTLDRTTRLNLGYRFTSHLGLDTGDPTAADDEERHHFVLGLTKSF